MRVENVIIVKRNRQEMAFMSEAVFADATILVVISSPFSGLMLNGITMKSMIAGTISDSIHCSRGLLLMLSEIPPKRMATKRKAPRRK